MSRVALFGARGFVGREILAALQTRGREVVAVTRDSFESSLGQDFDVVINAAMPAARFKAKNDPAWDFQESVEKTARIFYGTKFRKFVQVSSVSARCQTDTVYGRHKRAAEAVVDDGRSLIVRLGPMFGPTLEKGVLVDIANGKPVFVAGESRYAFAPVGFVAGWIADNLERSGVLEVGAKSAISLADLARRLELNATFEGAVDHQEMQTVEPGYPDVELVFDFMRTLRGAK